MTPQETIAHLQAQLDECRKVVAAKDALVRNHRGFMTDKILGNILSLTPADLASKVLVERSEWEMAKLDRRDLDAARALVCLPDESHSLVPQKIELLQLNLASERQAKVERGDMVEDLRTQLAECRKERDRLRTEAAAYPATKKKVLAECAEIVRKHYPELPT